MPRSIVGNNGPIITYYRPSSNHLVIIGNNDAITDIIMSNNMIITDLIMSKDGDNITVIIGNNVVTG